MNIHPAHKIFDLSGKSAVVTGGAGVLCGALCRGLAREGVKVAILDINQLAAEGLAKEINLSGGKAIAIRCDVCDRESLDLSAQQVTKSFGMVDILINGAGGNSAKATTKEELTFFDIPENALRWVFDLNLMGTMLASQVFGKLIAAQKNGCILNISSMNSYRPLTRIPAYSASKAAVSNFTQWLAVYMAQEYSTEIRVNAIAPGFFLTDQNHYIMIDKENGELTERGQNIIAHTPMKRFGIPEDLVGVVLWLVSPASSFVTGIVVPIDGGFSAFSGV
jgi:NAD(P)-dependent dehydrogenase (short-subunit alcohol dehydrogenase family)